MDPPKYQFDTDNSDSINKHYPNCFNDDKNTVRNLQFLPSYEDQKLQTEFVILNASMTGNIEVFVSADSFNKYKAFKKNQNNDMEQCINELQREGRCLPLLRANVSNNMFNSKHSTIYKFKPPDLGKTFDPKTDRFVFCKVTQVMHSRY